MGADVVIASGMGARAIDLFTKNGIKVIVGAPSLTPEELVKLYLDNKQQSGCMLSIAFFPSGLQNSPLHGVSAAGQDT